MGVECADFTPILLAVFGTIIGSVFSIICSSNFHQSRLAILVAVAAGMMSGCSIVMLMESVSALGMSLGLFTVVFGMFIMGLLDFLATKYCVSPNFAFSGLSGDKAVRVLILFLSLSVHSIGEGFSLGLAAVSPASGGIVSISLALHNIPEAAALSFAFKSKGVSDKNAILFAVFSTLPQSVLAFPVSSFFTSSELALGVSAGCMAWAVAHEILPEAINGCGQRLSLTLAASAALALIAFDVYSHSQIR